MSFAERITDLRLVLNVLLAAALALGGLIAWDTFNRDMRVPVMRWDSVVVLNSPVQPGEDLKTKITRVKVRDDCPVASSRQAISEDGVPINLQSGVWRGGDSEADYILFDYPIPRNIEPGRYTLRVFLTYTCPEFVWTTQQPDAPFRVVPE